MALTLVRRITFEAFHLGRNLSYALEVSAAGALDEATGIVVDFDLVRDAAREAVAEVLAAGAARPPTAENLVVAIWRALAPRVGPARLTRLRLWETPNQSVEYDGS